MAVVFWKDSMDFEKIIQNKEEVEMVQTRKEPVSQGGQSSKNKGVFLRNFKQ